MELLEKYKGKRLLILGGAAQCNKVVEAAREMGVYTIVTDINPHGSAYRNGDENLPYSVMDCESIIAWCEKNPVDGVLNYCIDFAQRSHQTICEHFGFPCYGTKEQYRIMTDKALFKKFCIENGVGVIPEYDEEHLSDVEYPVLVKPSESSGSRGSNICYNYDELKAAIPCAREESKNGGIIIERFLGGKPDFSMSYVVINGEPYLIRTLDRYVGAKEDNLNRQCICARSPSLYTDLYLKNAHNRVVAFIKKLGLQNATLFMQGFIDGDEFRFYDPAIRFAGSEYERMLLRATGVDIVKPFIAYALGGDLDPFKESLRDVYMLNGKCGLQLFLDAYPGKLETISGMDEVRSLPYVVSLVQKHNVGYVVPGSGDVKQRIFEAVVVLESKKEEAEKAISSIKNLIKLKNEKGDELLAPLVNPDVLF